jgi:hypothetical protein
MRLGIILILWTTLTTYGQTNVFALNKLESIDFKNFIDQKKIIVIGEMHGTTEVPLLVLQLANQIKRKKKPLTVALEIEKNLQEEINDFLKHGDFDKLLGFDYFKYPDGRTSIAMRELIKGLRRIKGVKVVCFDIESGLGSGFNRDSLMAVNLSKDIDEGQMIILTGNLHANLIEGYWRPGFKSAIFHLKKMNDLNNKIISLNTYFGGGTIWNCMGDGCKERDAGSNSSIAKKYGLTNFMVISDKIDANGYNGLIYFEKVTASKPMIRE